MSKQNKKGRKAGVAGQPGDASPSEGPELPPAPAHVPVGQIDVNALHQHSVDERQLMLLMQDWRTGRTNRNVRQALQDGYVAVFSVALIAAMVVSTIVRAQTMASSCSTASCTAARGLLPWAAMAGTFSLALAAALMFGPVVASAAEGFWLMDAPISRRQLLYKRLRLIIVAALGVGALIGALTAALTGSTWVQTLAWTVATGLGAAGLTAMAAAEQGAERTFVVRIVRFVVSAVGLVALLAVVAVASQWITMRIGGELALELPLAVAVVGLALLIGAGVIADQRLNRIRRARLMSGGSLVSGMQGAMFAMDFGLMRDLVVERDCVARGRVRPTHGRGVGLTALVWRDIQRLIRFPRPLILLIVSAVVPYAVNALGLTALVVPISALVLMAALIPFFGALRVLSRSKGLARMMPFSTRQVRQAVMIVPAGLALLWTGATLPAYLGVASGRAVNPDPLRAGMYALIAGVAGLIAAVRWVSAKSADYNAPMIATSAGAMPPGMMMNIIRGFDMVALITIWTVFGWPWVSLIVAAIAFSILSMGSMNQEDLQAMRDENERSMKAMKEQDAANRDKIKIPRSK